jgi:N-acetylmuramoyl-L-alanine amidase
VPDHVVRQGECISSIAFEFGLFWQTVWNHPANAELRELRKDPNVLFPGDVVFLPERTVRTEIRPTEARHRFVLKGVPEVLRLQLLDYDGEPRANLAYVLEVDGTVFSGTTDAEGELRHRIPPNARRGKLTVEGTEEFPLRLGSVGPISTVSGVQARLNNLGFDCDVDGVSGPKMAEALAGFQEKHGLPHTGELDEQTREKLRQAHGY